MLSILQLLRLLHHDIPEQRLLVVRVCVEKMVSERPDLVRTLTMKTQPWLLANHRAESLVADCECETERTVQILKYPIKYRFGK